MDSTAVEVDGSVMEGVSRSGDKKENSPSVWSSPWVLIVHHDDPVDMNTSKTQEISARRVFSDDCTS